MERGKELATLRNSTNRPFLHLVDGGVADNPGPAPAARRSRLRRPCPQVARAWTSRRSGGSCCCRSMRDPHLRIPGTKKESPPGILTLTSGRPSITMERYSKDTVAMMGMTVEVLEAEAPNAESGSLKFSRYR